MSAKSTVRNFLNKTKHPVSLSVANIATINLLVQAELREATRPEYRRLLTDLHKTIQRQVLKNNTARARHTK